MDAESGQQVRSGGTVEPVNRAAVAKQVFQTPPDPVGVRYELPDPFAEVTYRMGKFADMAAKADQLGAVRFFAVDPDGKRTPIVKVDDAWKRPDTRDAAPPARETPPRDRSTNVVPLATSAPSTGTVIAKVDAEAERAARVARLEAALVERYLIKRAPVTVGDVSLGQTEYRYRGDTSRIAFTESTFRLSTDNNSPSVARSMVDVAETRHWQALRVSGNEDFKRMVWLEASLRGVRTVGYEPQAGDHEVLRRERESRAVNRIEPAPSMTPGDPAEAAAKQSVRGSGGRKAVLAALEAVLVAKGVPVKQREAVMSAAAENLAQRLRDGQTLKVKVFDRSAPSQRPAVAPIREVQRARDRAEPTR